MPSPTAYAAKADDLERKGGRTLPRSDHAVSGMPGKTGSARTIRFARSMSSSKNSIWPSSCMR